MDFDPKDQLQHSLCMSKEPWLIAHRHEQGMLSMSGGCIPLNSQEKGGDCIPPLQRMHLLQRMDQARGMPELGLVMRGRQGLV
jgi:hypothetical protein